MKMHVVDYDGDMDTVAEFEVADGSTPGQIAQAAIEALGYAIYTSDSEDASGEGI